MTGPEHYREAERILERTFLEDHYRNYHLQTAQAHATLALAAATALMQSAAGMFPLAEYKAWVEAAAEPAASDTEAAIS